MTEHDDQSRLERMGLEQRIVTALDQRFAAPDDETLRRLAQARRNALASSRQRRRAWPAGATVASALAAAAAVMIAVAVIVVPDRPDLAVPPKTEDLDLLTREDFEVFMDDPAFYAWLAEQDADGAERSEEETSG
jgi:negative regulator of sigma E activity